MYIQWESAGFKIYAMPIISSSFEVSDLLPIIALALLYFLKILAGKLERLLPITCQWNNMSDK